MKEHRTFPVWVARAALPSVGFCGHQHSDRKAARNCATGHAHAMRRPWIVVQVRADGNETQEAVISPS
jgi:hypothetical protein